MTEAVFIALEHQTVYNLANQNLTKGCRSGTCMGAIIVVILFEDCKQNCFPGIGISLSLLLMNMIVCEYDSNDYRIK